MGGAAKQVLALLFWLTLIGVLTACVVAGIWLVVRAPQLLILGVVLLVVCCTLGALAGNLGQIGRR